MFLNSTVQKLGKFISFEEKHSRTEIFNNKQSSISKNLEISNLSIVHSHSPKLIKLNNGLKPIKMDHWTKQKLN